MSIYGWSIIGIVWRRKIHMISIFVLMYNLQIVISLVLATDQGLLLSIPFYNMGLNEVLLFIETAFKQYLLFSVSVNIYLYIYFSLAHELLKPMLLHQRCGENDCKFNSKILDWFNLSEKENLWNLVQ